MFQTDEERTGVVSNAGLLDPTLERDPTGASRIDGNQTTKVSTGRHTAFVVVGIVASHDHSARRIRSTLLQRHPGVDVAGILLGVLVRNVLAEVQEVVKEVTTTQADAEILDRQVAENSRRQQTAAQALVHYVGCHCRVSRYCQSR